MQEPDQRRLRLTPSSNLVLKEGYFSLHYNEPIPRCVAGEGCYVAFRDPMRQSRAV